MNLSESEQEAMKWAETLQFARGPQIIAALVNRLIAENAESDKRRWELEQHVGVLNATGFKDVITSRIEEVAKARARAESAERKLALAVEALGRIKKACDLDSVPMLKLAAVLCLQDLTKISSKEER